MREPNDPYSVALGTDRARGSVQYLTAQERSHHVYAIGKTGMGKSTLLESLALQDIHAGRGVCFVDPHGDSAERLAGCIPRARLNETIYFNLADRAYPIGFNPLSEPIDPDRRELMASQLLALFKTLFADSWGEWLEYLLKHCLLTLFEQESTAISLVSLQRMLVEESFREALVSRVRDPLVQQFWRDFFGELRSRDALERVSSTLNKVGKFGLSPVLRNIVGQTRSGFDLRRSMRDGQIVIVNLSKGLIGEDNANFIGSLLVTRIAQLAEERGELPPSERRPFHLFVDEFQTLSTRQFDKVVSEARKFGLALTLAHQNCSQIPDQRVFKSIVKTVGTRVAFSIDYEDAELIAKSFHPLRPDALSDSTRGRFWTRIGSGMPRPIEGFGPDLHDILFRDSLARVIENSQCRFARPRDVVERDFARWWGRPDDLTSFLRH